MYRGFKWTRASAFRNELTKAYEPIQPLLLQAFAECSKSTVFIDIGANIGAYSVLMSDVGGICEIHAFEPSPTTFGELVRNVELNGLEGKITVHQKAVSDSAGPVLFGIVNPLSGANSILHTSIHSTFQGEVEVDAVTLDEYLPFKDERLCLKIDVEGHERKVLAGMSSVLSRNSVLLQIEDYQSNADELPMILERFGLRSICRVGPDRFFTNADDFTDADAISAFETASGALVRETLADLQERGGGGIRPVELTFGNWMTVVLKGTAASTARRIRHPWRKR